MDKRVIKAREVMDAKHLEMDGMATVAQALAAMKAENSDLVIVKKRNEHDAFGIYQPPFLRFLKLSFLWQKSLIAFVQSHFYLVNCKRNFILFSPICQAISFQFYNFSPPKRKYSWPRKRQSLNPGRKVFST